MNKLQDRINRIMEEACPGQQPGASLMITKGDEILVHNGYGLADLPGGIPSDPNSTYLIASVSKQFTCAAILLLAEAGQLSIDDSLGKYVDGFSSYREQVTIRQMMNHTSGIPDYFDPHFLKTYCQEESPSLNQEELVSYISDRYPKLEFEPGSDWAYSNSAYVILGFIVERVAGLPFEQFLQKRIFDPLGMDHTKVGISETREPGMAVGYDKNPEGSYIPSVYNRIVVGWADGNIISNCRDLHKWLRALYTGKVLSPNFRESMLSPTVLNDGRTTPYGFGWFIYHRRGLVEHWHTGSTVGYHCRMSYFPEKEVAVICLLNSEKGIDGDLNIPFTTMVNAVLEDEMEPLPAPVSLSRGDLQLWKGKWREVDLAENSPLLFTITEDSEGGLRLSGNLFGTTGDWLLIPENSTKLYLASGADYYLIRDSSDEGSPGLVLNSSGREIRMELREEIG